MSQYTFTKTIRSDKLVNEIKAATLPFLSLETLGDNVTVIMTTALNSEQETSLNSVISSHDPALSTLEQLEVSSVYYIEFGNDLWEEMIKKTWAFNTYLKIQGTPLTSQEMQTLLSNSTMIEKCLKTGSLLTAKDVINYLISVLPQYSAIGNYAVAAINTYLGV